MSNVKALSRFLPIKEKIISFQKRIILENFKWKLIEINPAWHSFSEKFEQQDCFSNLIYLQNLETPKKHFWSIWKQKIVRIVKIKKLQVNSLLLFKLANKLEELFPDDRLARLVVLLLGDPHLAERVQTRQNRTAYPRRIQTLLKNQVLQIKNRISMLQEFIWSRK